MATTTHDINREALILIIGMSKCALLRVITNHDPDLTLPQARRKYMDHHGSGRRGTGYGKACLDVFDLFLAGKFDPFEY